MSKTLKIDKKLLRKDTKLSQDINTIIKWFIYITVGIVIALISLILSELVSANFESAVDWCTKNTGDRAYCEHLAR